MVKLKWFKIAVVISSIIIMFVSLRILLNNKERGKSLNPDSCVYCHKNIKTVGRAHPISIFGCASCHGGDKYSFNKNEAHRGMVLNPARLEYVDKYCGKCHADVIERVDNSIMVTEKGVLGVLYEKFTGKGEFLSVDKVKDIKNPDLTTNYFKKMCTACHVNQLQTIF